MRIEQTTLQDCYLCHPTVFSDDRGYFFERYNKQKFNEALGQEIHFVQDNQAKSNYGVIRGLHFQKGQYAQAKLVSVLQGSVLDVAVDLRKNSPSFGKTYTVILSGENKLNLFLPRGFAHGYSVLEDNTIFFYKCDNFYNKESEGGLYFDDPFLNIDWQIPSDKRILSDKDVVLPKWEEFNSGSMLDL